MTFISSFDDIYHHAILKTMSETFLPYSNTFKSFMKNFYKILLKTGKLKNTVLVSNNRIISVLHHKIIKK